MAQASNCGGEKPSHAMATATVGSGRRIGLPRSLAMANGGSSTTGVRGVAQVQRHRPDLWCARASQCSSGHVGQVEGSSGALSGFGHGGGLLRPWQRSGDGLVLVAKAPRLAIDDSVYAVVLLTSWRCCDYVLVRRGGRVREWWCTTRRRHREHGVHALCYGVQGLGGGRGCARECAVLAYPEAGDVLGLRAHGMERHGRSSMVQWRAGNEPGLTVGVVEEGIVVQ